MFKCLRDDALFMIFAVFDMQSLTALIAMQEQARFAQMADTVLAT